MLDLTRFTEQQREVILAPDGPHLVIAGPGSGKTTVLAARIAYLVLNRNVPPATILAIAFTRTAARQLRGTLSGILDQQARDVDIVTFHSLGFRIIRQWSRRLGFDHDRLTVYGPEEVRGVIRELAQAVGGDVQRWPLDELVQQVERFRFSGEVPGAEAVPRLARALEDALRLQNAVDFAAMLALPLRLFHQHADVLRLCQDAYRHLLADEFQDVSEAQYALLQQLAERQSNLLVVGDPSQSLYAWRGAGPLIFQAFSADFPDGQLHQLDQNFRSTTPILEVANSIGRRLTPPQALWTTSTGGAAPVVCLADDEKEEAAYVACEIVRLLNSHAVEHPGEVAILYRLHAQAQDLIAALRDYQVPYLVRGESDLFAKREVRDALAYLRLADDVADAQALARIVNRPPRGLEQLARSLRLQPVPASELLLVAEGCDDQGRLAVEGLHRLLQGLHQQRNRLSSAALLDLALDASGYRAWLLQQPDGSIRLSSLAALRSVLAAGAGDLTSWLADVQLGAEAELHVEDGRRVVLSTIHRAKGDQWRVVFLVGAEDGLLPHRRAVKDDLATDDELQDELRLAYVAVTRPRERLYLTYCRERRRNGRLEASRPSRFLRGMPSGLFTRAA